MKNKNIKKVSLVAIAKNEDNYIDEWIRYHLAFGIDDIFIYQNDWRASLKSEYSGRVHLIEFDGECRQLQAYNHFIQNYHNEYEFSAFFDIDEFISIDNCENIKDWLNKFLDFGAISINWRLFGDSGIAEVQDNDYSLLRRFVNCGRFLNKHVKQILNFNVIKDYYRFINPHFIVPNDIKMSKFVSIDTSKTKYVIGPFNESAHYNGVQLNHYLCKTIQEWASNKIPKGKPDFPYKSPQQIRTIWDFNKFNHNDIQHTTALDFAIRHNIFQPYTI